MERILAKRYGGFDAAGLGELREDASVLAYLFHQLETHRPAHAAKSSEFSQALNGVRTSVENLLTAARSAEPAAARQAIRNLKQPYAMLFLRFG